MFKKLLIAAALIVSLTIPAVASDGITAGQYSGYKNELGVYYVIDYEGNRLEYVMITDTLRVNVRAKKMFESGNLPISIFGVRIPNGEYRVFARTFFMQLYLGTMTWETIQANHPSTAITGELKPNMFQTFVGFEDIWFYMDFHEDDMPKVKELIRALNNEALKKEETR